MSTVSAIGWTAGGVHHTEVFAINYNNFVAERTDGGNWNVNYSLRVSQISAGLDTNGNPVVYAIGSNDHAVYANDNGAGWVDLGGYAKVISTTSDNFQFLNSVFVIGGDNAVYVNYWTGNYRGYFRDLGGDFTSISVGHDSGNNPEVYAIGTDHAVYASDGESPWVYRGGDVTAISASTNNTVFAIGGDNGVWINGGGTGWTGLGGPVTAISAGVDAAGNPEVYAIGTNNALYLNDNGGGWIGLGGYVTEISATSPNTVAAWGQYNTQVYVNYGWGFVSLGTPPYIIS